jgi:hypothetical protein
MGTSASYSGSGSKPAKDLRQGIAEWLDSQQDTPQPGGEQHLDSPSPVIIPSEALLPSISLLRPGSRSRSGGGGGGASGGASSGDSKASKSRNGGGAQRSVQRSASTAGRAAAAAYAFSQGDREALEKLGLSFDELQQIDNPLDLVNKIVDAACGAQDDSTIDGHEQRIVAAEVADWVLTQSDSGSQPSAEDIVRKSIACVVSEVIASETGEMLRQGEWSPEVTAKFDRELRESADVLAEQAELSIDNVSEGEFARAIEKGIETLRNIIKGDKK